MQTFLPYASFMESAECLDNKRLGKQRVEAKQIWLALNDNSNGWQHHPAVKMWIGCAEQLADYGVNCCAIWKERGFADNLLDWFAERANCAAPLPSWWGDAKFHLSHRSNLIRKDPVFYGPKWPGVPANLPYVWPTFGSCL
jgi:hypothetical protein